MFAYQQKINNYDGMVLLSQTEDAGKQIPAIGDVLAIYEDENHKLNVAQGTLASDGTFTPSVQPGPSGTLPITVNGTYDITDYASVEINVGLVTLTANGNGALINNGEPYGTEQISVAAGGQVESNAVDSLGWCDPVDLIGVTILGWSSTAEKATAHEHDITFPLTVTENTTIYLDWEKVVTVE